MYQLMKQRDGQRSEKLNNIEYSTKQEAVNALHEYCGLIADSKDAIYHWPDDSKSNVKFTSDTDYDDILNHPSESDDSIRIDVYVYYIEKV